LSCLEYAQKSGNTEIVEVLEGFLHFFAVWLPDEILLEIFYHLSGEDILRAGCVCRKFQRVANDQRLWQYQLATIRKSMNFPKSVNPEDDSVTQLKSSWKRFASLPRQLNHHIDVDWDSWRNAPPATGPAEYDFIFKFSIIGNDKVGKTSLLDAFATRQPISPTPASVTEFKVKTVGFRDKVVKMQIWDVCPSRQNYRYGHSTAYRGHRGIIICYDITDAESWKDVKGWLGEIDRYASINVRKMVVGCKADLVEQRAVDAIQVVEFCEENNLIHIEVSATTLWNVDMAFALMLKDVMNAAMETNDNNKSTSNKNQAKAKKSECTVS